MADDDPDALRRLEEDVRRARARGGQPHEEDTPPSKLGIAFRLSTEFVAAVVVGGGIGWFLDRLFGTSPFLLIAMFFLGVAAGFLTVWRTAREMTMDADGPGEGR